MAERVTQEAVEVVTLPTTVNARLTQIAVEAISLPSTVNARLTQLAVEVVLTPDPYPPFPPPPWAGLRM